MGLAEQIAIMVPIFSGLAYMAYHHRDWFMPFSTGVLVILVPVWGILAGFVLGISVAASSVPAAADKKIAESISELAKLPIGPSMFFFSIVGVFLLRQVSEYAHQQRERNKKANSNPQ